MITIRRGTTNEFVIALTDEEEDKIMAFLNTLTGEHQGKMLTNDNLQK